MAAANLFAGLIVTPRWPFRRSRSAMMDPSLQWKELKAKFLRELSPGEQLFFLKKARECVQKKGYPVSEDLFHYCFFLTVEERLRLIDPQGCDGMMRIMLVQSRKEVQDERKVFERRLEEKKQPAADRDVTGLLDYLSSGSSDR
jgi:hypothetical protein